jgi:protease-4
LRRLRRILVLTLALIGLVTVVAVGLGSWAVLRVAEHGAVADLPSRMVLTLDLEARFKDLSDPDPFAALAGEKTYGARQAVMAIERASADPRVTGLFASLGHASLGLAQIQEIRQAVGRFRAAGKPAVLFAETMGEGGGGTADYYLASGFGSVWLQPSGEVGLTGLWVESPFIKGTLDLLGIKPQFFGRHEYKSAIEMFTETGFSAAHKENLGQLLDSWEAQLAAGIAEARKLPADKARNLLGSGPYLPAEAKAMGLIDAIGYRDEALASLLGDDKADEVDLADYAESLPEPKGAKVALITGSGAIQRGDSPRGLDGDGGFGARTVAEAFRDAADDEAVKAILFRVDSPGGSYTASDTVWHEVKRARAGGKPVVVSMGNVAASGGYFVAMAADRIIAQPGTITGSIGVFSGKLAMAEFWGKLGIKWDELHKGDNAGMWSMNQPFSAGGQARLNALLDAIYADFTTKAGEGRKLSPDRMDKLARGRIWSGADAKVNGLVDELGGWHEALDAVRALAKLAPGAEIDLVEFPRPKKVWEVLAEGLAGAQVSQGRLARAAVMLEPWLGPLAQLRDPGPTLRMEPVRP